MLCLHLIALLLLVLVVHQERQLERPDRKTAGIEAQKEDLALCWRSRGAMKSLLQRPKLQWQ